MSIKTLVDIPVDILGGRNTSMAPSDLPIGASPDNQDVVFPEGTVETRNGISPFFAAPLSPPSSVTGLKTYITPDFITRLMAYDDLGTLWQENPVGAMQQISSGNIPGNLYQSDTLFGREYMAFYNGPVGNDMPRQYDNQYYDRVSQCGPGSSPIVSPYIPSAAAIINGASSPVTIVASPTGLVLGGLFHPPGSPFSYYTYFTCTTGAAHGLTVGDTTVIAGSTSTGYNSFNGPWVVASVPNSTSFTVDVSIMTSAHYTAGNGGGGTSTKTTGYSAVRLSNQVTVTTTYANGFQAGWTVQISGLPNQVLSYTSLTFTAASGVVTVTLNGGSTAGLYPGTMVIVAGVSDNTFNGTFPVDTVISNTQFTYSALTASMSPSSYIPEGWVDSANPDSGGSGGYVTDDVLAIVGGNGTGAVQVSSVDGLGNPLAYTVISPGGGYSAGTSSTAGGTGSGATIDITVGGLTLASVSTSFNGLFTIVSLPTITSFTYTQLGPDYSINSAGGLATIVGNISGGLHQVSVAFITRQGYITNPASPQSFYAPGNQLASVGRIPTGPSNIVGRLLIFTPAITPPATNGTFYSITATMQINDNTTTSLIVDFNDATLISSFNAEYLFGQQELGECSFVAPYNSRLLWMGERNKLQNFVNLSFDGGWSLGAGAGASDLPLGWTSDVTYGAGASRDTTFAAWQDALRITGDGTALNRGMVYQGAYQDWLAVGIIRQNTAYSYRARIWAHSMTTGNCTIDLHSASSGVLGSAVIPYSAMSGSYSAELIGTLVTAQSSIPTDLQLRVYGGGTINSGGFFTIDCIEIFPTLTPANSSVARVSYVNNPESYDGVTGTITVRPNDGQSLRAGFPIRNNYYLAKDHYLCYVADNGQEPALWPVNEVSATIGICGPNAWDTTEEWAVFAERTGVYVCMGSDPIKIMQEIQEDASNSGKVCWNSINWDYGHTLWVLIDQQNKRILVGAPTGSATSPNIIFMMDYKFSSTPDYIAAGPGVVYSQFTGRILSHGAARKWTIWNISSPAVAFSERPDGTAIALLGNGASNGKIYNLPSGNYTDDGAPINSYYQTSALPQTELEQALQLRSQRKLHAYASGRVIGSAALPGTVSSMTWNVGTVSVTMSQSHGLAVGQWVIVSNAADATYNGWQQVVTIISPSVFTFLLASVTYPSTTGASVCGTIDFQSIASNRTARIRGIDVSDSSAGDFERNLNIQSERVIYQFGTGIPGAHWRIEKFFASMRVDAITPVRGGVGP